MKLSIPATRQTVRLLTLLAAAVAIVFLSSASPASAQAVRIGGTVPHYPGAAVRGTDTSYDPKNDIYLLVQGAGKLYGVFVDSAGQKVTPIFTILDGITAYGQFPRAIYCPDLSNGAGGNGAFLVFWNEFTTVNTVQGRIISREMPGYFVSGAQRISDPSQGTSFFENRPVAAYSSLSKRFLFAWTTTQPSFGLQGRFVDTNGSAVGPVIRFAESGSRDPDVVWNPQTNEFGMINTGWSGTGAFVTFRRVGTDGSVAAKTTFGYAAGTYATGIDLNSSNQYVLAWALAPGTRTAIFDQAGNSLSGSTGAYVSGRIGYDQSLGLASNPNSNSLLVVSSDSNTFEVAAAELYSNGEPKAAVSVVTDGAALGSFYPLTSARTASGVSQWDVVYSRDFKGLVSQIVGSGSPGSTPSAPAPAPAPTPTTPTTSTSSCSGSDPFASIGGGTCCSGGWLPPGMTCSSGGSSTTPTPAPAPTPAPTPSTSSCSGSDPFAAMGGGVCCSGGWIMKSMSCSSGGSTSTSTPTTSTATCSGSDPFAAMGGGVCCNGGWIMKSMSCSAPTSSTTTTTTSTTSSTSCVGTDPFAAIGGGKCVNGGWIPLNMSR